MRPVFPGRGSSPEGAPAQPWFARGRQVGLGLLVVFTVKGICTTAFIAGTLLAAMEEMGMEMSLLALVWTMSSIGGLAALGEWRRVSK